MAKYAICRAAAVVLAVVALAGCGSSASSPQAPSTPAPTPTPTPEPAGAVRFIGATLPAGSTVAVAPLYVVGQQAPQLSFTAAIAMRARLDGAVVRAWVRTDTQRCMGGGQAHVDFEAGVERGVAPLGMSHPGSGMALCALPYTTTHVEFDVFDTGTQQSVLEVRFPAVYHFVAE